MNQIFKTIVLSTILFSGGACLPAGNDKAAAGQGATDAVPLAETVSANAPPKRSPVQVGPWYPATFNIEEPYIDILHASSIGWNGGDRKPQELLDMGVIDKVTGLPKSLPDGKWLTSSVYFTGNDAGQMMNWDGEWVLEWEGDADLWIEYLPSEMQWRETKNRIEFMRDYKRGKTPYHSAIQIRRLKTPLTALRLFRKENEAALRAGKIYNPRFVDAVSRYDILRTMDLQSANSVVIRSIDDLPGESAPFWANTAWQNEGGIVHPYQGMPLNAVFAAGVETGTQIWFQAPITLGAPRSFSKYKPADGAIDVWANNYRAMAKANTKAIIESPEWDRYADAFVTAMIESGYPADRPLYTSLANEVWNFSGQYFMTTSYAWGIGEGLHYNGHEPLRVGYGALMARWKLALDAALARADREQPVVYVIEGQAYFPARTMFALSGAKAYLESKGEAWDAHAPDFGISVASYWSASWEAFASAEEWPKLIAEDPDGTAKRFADFIINDPAQFGLKSVVDVIGQNKREGDKYGVRLIGAYEGGSHLERPSYIDKSWYAGFVWGEQGGRVNEAVNQTIAKAFPGFILSNYVLAGPTGGQPWFEGPYGAGNPYERSWGPFLRPQDAAKGAAREE
ncbi:hypothetical protein [Hyphococcus sp.]|uniref:hypothetical protein n=1 Tax=Hyphococcus sp. TaxID=2038636 RepID=UPI00208A7D03|nr:MAG: hypothetical protein DHS20C04_10390 [Marinicaulis sp.]